MRENKVYNRLVRIDDILFVQSGPREYTCCDAVGKDTWACSDFSPYSCGEGVRPLVIYAP